MCECGLWIGRRWMDRCIDSLIYGRVNGRMEGRTAASLCVRIGGWIDKGMVRQMDRWQ
jgi:hypothetical protein